MNFQQTGKKALQALYGISAHLKQSHLEEDLLELLYFRVSQINGCAYCLDMHSKDLLAKGESGQRLYCLAAWREAPFYSEEERAALSWAEALTELEGKPVSDAVYADVSARFSEEELIDLTLAVTTINTYNRFNLAFGSAVGSYKVGQFS